jgi:hypothetical protein
MSRKLAVALLVALAVQALAQQATGTLPEPWWHKFFAGTINVDALLAFAFGTLGVIAMLTFAVLVPNPTHFSQFVFIVVLALAAAGVGAMLPGSFGYQSGPVSATGAVTLFFAVMAARPKLVDAVAKLIPPDISPNPVIETYLEDIDAGKVDAAWEQLDVEAKKTIARDREAIRRVYATGRAPLGAVSQRTEIGLQELRSPSGFPLGLYRIVTYRTRFASGAEHLEMVSVRATDDLKWRVFGHNISPAPINVGMAAPVPAA